MRNQELRNDDGELDDNGTKKCVNLWSMSRMEDASRFVGDGNNPHQRVVLIWNQKTGHRVCRERSLSQWMCAMGLGEGETSKFLVQEKALQALV